MDFKRISPAQANSLLEQGCQIIDIRDALSYQAGHLPNAILIDNSNVQNFLAEANKQTPVLVYCYHGMSSQSAAAYFAEQGFQEVYSLEGGYEVWKLNFPTES
ncbi:MAG TPA: thiosulfate sulfurtransferase GlpE [Pseudomonadales bacterium]|nr:thiosulfate sulfurtransferase GlpE [Pseudomonadales bacterium]